MARRSLRCAGAPPERSRRGLRRGLGPSGGAGIDLCLFLQPSGRRLFADRLRPGSSAGLFGRLPVACCGRSRSAACAGRQARLAPPYAASARVGAHASRLDRIRRGAGSLDTRRGARPLGRHCPARARLRGQLPSGGGRGRCAPGRNRRRTGRRSSRRNLGPPAAAGIAGPPGPALSPPSARSGPERREDVEEPPSTSLATCARAGSARTKSARRSGLGAGTAEGSSSVSVELRGRSEGAAGDASAAADGACAISSSMRSRSRLKAASILPSNSRVRASLIAIGSTKLPLMMTS